MLPGAKTLACLSLIVSVTTAAPVAAQTAEPPPTKPLILITGEITGLYYPVGGAICRLVSKDRDRHGLRCVVEPSAGSGANVMALRSGEADLAIVQSRAHRQAYQGEAPFADGGKFEDMRSLAALHGEAVVLLAAKGSGIAALADLKGKKVNLGRPNSFQRLMAETALAAAGLTPADLGSAFEMDLAQQRDGLCDGVVDAAFFAGLHPMAMVQETVGTCEAEFVDLSKVAAAENLNKAPFLAPQTIPAEVYDGLAKDLSTVAMKATLVAGRTLPDDVAYEVVKALVDNFDAFQAQHPLLRDLDKQALAAHGLTAPLHPGAARFYEENSLLK